MKRTNLIKKIVTLGTVATLGASMLATPVIAGSFVTDANGKWYDNGDGTYPKSTWQWIDEDGDGKAYSYYFDDNGYVVIGFTPDGYFTDGTGAWLENGIAAVKDVTVGDLASTALNAAQSVASALASSEKASQSAVDAVNGITSTTTSQDKETTLSISQTSTGLAVSEIVTKKHTVTKTSNGASSTTEDSGPDMSQTSYDTFGPSVPAGANTTSVAPTTDVSTIDHVGPNGEAAVTEED